jgi:hypothetical protein
LGLWSRHWLGVVGLQHTILTAIWHLATNGTLYHPGPDYYTRLHPELTKNRAIEQLRRMGYTVNLQPPANEKAPDAQSNRRVRGLRAGFVDRADGGTGTPMPGRVIARDITEEVKS